MAKKTYTKEELVKIYNLGVERTQFKSTMLVKDNGGGINNLRELLGLEPLEVAPEKGSPNQETISVLEAIDFSALDTESDSDNFHNNCRDAAIAGQDCVLF